MCVCGHTSDLNTIKSAQFSWLEFYFQLPSSTSHTSPGPSGGAGAKDNGNWRRVRCQGCQGCQGFLELECERSL